MKKIEPYLIEFNEDWTMKDKKYPFDCVIEDANWRSVIVITNDKSTFSVNNNIWKIWTRKNDSFH